MEQQSIWSIILEQATSQHWTEVTSVVFGILYIIFAARGSIWCWVFGLLGAVLWAWAAYNLYQLYVETVLQFFYAGISLVGIYQWQYGSRERQELPITRMRFSEHALLLGAGVLLSLVVGYLFQQYTAAALPYVDTFTTVFSILVTFLVVQKKIENWWYWMVINTVNVGLYWSRGSFYFSLLFVLYLILAVDGYVKWRKEMETSSQ